jgi:hypothetical protein
MYACQNTWLVKKGKKGRQSRSTVSFSGFTIDHSYLDDSTENTDGQIFIIDNRGVCCIDI